jgi:hypothetical protein
MVAMALVLAACANVAPIPIPTGTTAEAFTPIAKLIQQQTTRTDTMVTTAGYAFADASGVRLVDTLSFSAGATPQPLSTPQQQIWLGEAPSEQLTALVHTAGTARIASVRARGMLQGPATFGPNGSYQYQLVHPQFALLVPQDVTFQTLFANGTAYENRFVRVMGTLFAQGSSGLLVEKTDINGVPAPQARQIKLSTPIRDTALLARLQQARDQNVHFGPVQIEGFWHNGSLMPFAIFPTS